ncbi:hypothetical protein [Thermocrinis sp.]
MVVLPTISAILYYAFISTPVYVSESKIVVKSMGGGDSLSGLGALLKTFGVLDNTQSFGNLLVNYVQSRDVMFGLDREFKIKQYYSSEEWDMLKRFAPFGFFSSYEHFLEYYRSFVVNAYIDPANNLVVIITRGKDPEYPYRLNKRLLQLSESFANEMNRKIYGNALTYFENRLEENKQKIRELAKKIANFLNKTGVVSPEQQIGVLLQATAKLQEQLITKELELSRLESIAPQNPRIQDLRREIAELRKEIGKNMQKITGTSSSIGPVAVELELLKSEMTMLIKELEANLSAYLQARNQTAMQLVFVETVESPIKPDAPMEPKAIKNILTVFALSFVIWALYWFITSAAREHAE